MIFQRTKILGLIAAGLLSLGLVAGAKAEVTIAYQPIIGPWIAGIKNGSFEKATGTKIDWRSFSSGSKVLTALASGDLHVGVAGSSPIASGVSNGVATQLIWILDDIASAEALIVRNGSGINAPQDLRGKKIGVPFVSTTHFHMLFALEQLNIPIKDVELINMQPPAIAAAWERGDIDAAFVWDPARAKIAKTGKVLLTSGLLSSWGKATFDGMIANTKWAKKNAGFVTKLLKHIDYYNESYRTNPGAWGVDSKNVKDIASILGASPADVVAVLKLYRFPTLSEQTSDAWLGGGAITALQATSEFLKKEKKVQNLLPDYATAVNKSYAVNAGK